MDNRLIQIIPAPAGLFARTYTDDGDRHEKQVICLGLTELSIIQFYYLGDDGICYKTRDIVDRRSRWAGR